MLNRLNISKRFTLLVLLGSGCVLAAIVTFSYFQARKILVRELKSKAMSLAQAAANRIGIVEASVAKVAEGIALCVESSPGDEQKVYEILEKSLADNPDVFGSAVALEPLPGSVPSGMRSPYVHRNGASLVRKDLGASSYRYDVWDWYAIPKEMGRPMWSEPYFDVGGGDVLMATYSVPIFSGGPDRTFAGVVTCDVSIEWLRDLLDSLPFGGQGYAFIISGNGTIISHPTKKFIMNETLFSLAEERKDDNLRRVGRSMIKGETDFVPIVSLTRRRPSYLAYTPIPSTGWSLGALFYKDVILTDVTDLMRKQLCIGLAGFLLLYIVIAYTSRSVTRPIQDLSLASGRISSGDFSTAIEEPVSQDEVAVLARSFEKMRENLVAHISQLQAATAAKERIESELRIAHAIQMDLVPKRFPDSERFQLFALLEPARQVGGDFYDFSIQGGDTLCCAVGDVSGKGMPAALLMAVTRTFMLAFAGSDTDPSAILTRLNEEIGKGNEEGMFVTLFIASVELSSGRCRYANAGHNPPFLVREGGEIAFLPKVKGLPLGILPEASYTSGELDLNPRDLLFMYSDGLTEAMNRDEELFSEGRVMEALRSLRSAGCEEIVHSMKGKIVEFADGAEQSDDITLFALRFLGEAQSKGGPEGGGLT